MKPATLRTWLQILALMSSLAICGCGQNTAPPSTGSSAAAITSSAPAAPPVTATASSSAATQPAAITADEPSETIDAPTNQAEPALALRNQQVAPPPKSKWVEGTNYLRLTPAQPTSAGPGQIEVTEFFWYGCPHCYALDPYLETWRKNKPSYISFVRVPILWGQIHALHARIYYTEQALGKFEALHTEVFNEFHQNQHPLNTVDDVQAFFVKHGVSKADFDDAFRSKAVEASLTQAQALGLRYKVESVPLIVINGKYVTDVGKAGGQQQLISLINDLAASEHGN